MGPTACGKTALAMALHKHLSCDVISVDSAMVYRHLDIGSAKPSPAELAQVPHRLIDICEPTEPYSVAQFCNDAEREINHSVQQGRLPLLVGGTMLYFHALQHGLSPLPASDPRLRQQLEHQLHQKGVASLHQRLETIDPDVAKRIRPQDTQRLLRALEVYEMTGRPLSSLWQQSKPQAPKLPAPVYNLILWPSDRQALYKRIEQRLDHLLDQGFIEEVKYLKEHYAITEDLPARRAIGYRHVWDYLDNNDSIEELREKIRIATCQFAKRQLTWLRRPWPNEHRFEITFDRLDENGLPEGLLNAVVFHIQQPLHRC